MKIPHSRNLLKNLYQERGFSVSKIAKHLNFSEGKVNYWLSRYNIQKRSISEAVYRMHNPDGDPFVAPSNLNYQSMHFIAGLGLGLYWGEGNKRNPTSVRLGNTDPKLIKAFVRFLLKIFKVKPSKLRFGLQIFSDMPPRNVLSFWISQLRSLGIKKQQFQKVIVTPARSIGTYREKSQHGVLTVYCSNVRLKNLIDNMLAEYKV